MIPRPIDPRTDDTITYDLLRTPRGATAPEAAGAIHTDLERGFIRAEVVGYRDLVDAGSLEAAKAAGKVRVEGKDYIAQDGDVMEFRFNV